MLKQRQFTIHAAILSVFVPLFLGAIMIIMALTYTLFNKEMLSLSNNLLNRIASTVIQEVSNHVMMSIYVSKRAAHLIQEGAINPNNPEEINEYIDNLVQTTPNLYAAYWGDPQGNYFEGVWNNNATYTNVIINSAQSPPIRKEIHYDANFKKISTSSHSLADFQVTSRPWYKMAVKKQQQSLSDVYVFFKPKSLGITAATPVYDKQKQLLGVFGTDMLLSNLSKFMTQLQVSQYGIAFIINKEGELIAYPHLETKDLTHLHRLSDMHNTWAARSFQRFLQHGKTQFHFVDQGRRYLAVYKRIPAFQDKTWYVACVVPERDLVGGLLKTSYQIIGVCLVILLLGTLLIRFLARRISSSLKELSRAAKKIQGLELDKPIHSHSAIVEVKQLAKVLEAMRTGLISFARYVPASLVRQLIKRDHAVQPGGVKKPLTVMFSDIQNFTSIAERSDPESLLMNLSEYFDYLTHIIMEQSGTVDKYIGDAIMAFWGAPNDDIQHALHACLAALKCQETLASLNHSWQQQGRAPFITRIGIASGEMVVGNLGSRDRMNYTALGDPVNLAARLEAINKLYGTRILVNSLTQQYCADKLLFRVMDKVQVMGKQGYVYIYELLGRLDDETCQPLIAMAEQFSTAFDEYQAQQWDLAMQHFNAILNTFPDDQASKTFIQRCQHYKENPPSEDWNGVRHLSSK